MTRWKAAYGGSNHCPDGLYPHEPESVTDLHCWRCEALLVLDDNQPKTPSRGFVDRCPVHFLPEPCPRCEALKAAGL